MFLYIIYAITYLFFGALLDRIMRSDKADPESVVLIVFWPFALILAALIWVADEIVKYFRSSLQKSKGTVDDPLDLLSIRIQAEEYANALPIDFEDEIISSGQLRHYAKKDFVAGAKWVLTKLPGHEKRD